MRASASAETGGRARALAARAVAEVLAGASLDTALDSAQRKLNQTDRALLQQLAFGVLREWRLLEYLVRSLTREPPQPAALAALLAVGIYQLRSLRVPAYAAVSSTVAASQALELPRARGLVNAVLRRYQREREALEAQLPKSPALRSSHPDWLVRQLGVDWPQCWSSVLAANNLPAPLWLRVNRQRTDRDAYLAQLRVLGLEAVASARAPQALALVQPVPVAALPGFADGLVSVQDAAAQLAAALLQTQAGQRVLDTCAAPGGKTAHLLELCPTLELLALDVDAVRLQRVAETLSRLALHATTRCGDAAQPKDWWDQRPFDRILLDAPCSGSGVIRRHPDIKWLRRASDIPKLAARQLGLLRALWPLLKPGGRLLYATCSTLTAENDAVIGAFVAGQRGARVTPVNADWGEATRHGRRIAPGMEGMDGFYYSVLLKRSG